MSYGGYKDQGNPYGNPYTSASNTEAGYGQGQEQHEMQTYTQQGQYGEQQYNTLESYNAPPADLQDFLRRRNGVAEQISKLGGETDSISTKQREALRSASPEHLQQEVQEMIQRFRLTASNIRSQIQALNDEATREGNETKVQHVNILFGDFKNKLSALQQAESGYNQDLRQRMMREYRIVHPNAPDEEAMRAVSDQASYGEGGVFTQALQQNRTNQARAVLGKVQARHNEILQIEKQMNELALLFENLDTMVVQQEAVIRNAEHQTEQTNVNIGKGTEEVDKGIEHARRARRNKWICLGITVLIILIAVAVGVGVGITQNQAKQVA